MTRIPFRRVVPFLVLAALHLGCGFIDLGGDDTPPPAPPPATVQPVAVAPTPAPTGLSSVTVSANSNPAGATVTGGGRELGVTPLTTQVPIPAPAPGQPTPSFDFVFAKEGFESTTIQAAPVNGTINITAALAPAGTNTEGTEGTDGTEGGGRVIQVTGRGGGAITDNHTTTSRATVEEDCTIRSARVTVGGNHSFNRDLIVRLSPPNGGGVTLQNHNNRDPFRSYPVRAVAGRQGRGTWTLRITDDVQQDTGRLRRFALRLECR